MGEARVRGILVLVALVLGLVHEDHVEVGRLLGGEAAAEAQQLEPPEDQQEDEDGHNDQDGNHNTSDGTAAKTAFIGAGVVIVVGASGAGGGGLGGDSGHDGGRSRGALVGRGPIDGSGVVGSSYVRADCTSEGTRAVGNIGDITKAEVLARGQLAATTSVGGTSDAG